MEKINKTKKKVFVSGCFDLVHSGHVAFFERASRYGDLYVSIGSDKTYREYKHKDPVYNEEERKFIIGSLKCVKKAFISRPRGKLGPGVIDFAAELKKIKPDYFIVGHDSNVTPEKRAFVESTGAKFVVIKRVVYKRFVRSTTSLREILKK